MIKSSIKKGVLVKIFVTLFLFSFSSFSMFAQSRIVSGIVKDTEGIGMVGVTVLLEGSISKGTLTDINGYYSIDIGDSDNSTLSFSYIGYVKQTVKIKNNLSVSIILQEDNKVLQEVVVVGYGVQKKETITGAMTTISNEQLIKSPVSNVSNALSGRLSGVTLVQRSGEPGRDQSEIRIRGISTLNSDQSTPLIVIDGVERSSMDGIDMNEIESINVLKDASATAVYGIRGANGVIILTTKIGKESKPKVSMSINHGFQTPTKLPEFLDSYGYAYLKNEGMRNDGLVPFYDEDALNKFKYGTDPVIYPTESLFDRFFKKISNKEQYNLNISGGTKDAKYFVSLGYLSQEGQYDTSNIETLNIGFDPNPMFQRYNVRSNFDFNIGKNLVASIKLGGQFTNSNYPNRTTESLFSSILNSPPMIGYGIYEGKLITGYLNDPLSFITGRGLSTESVLLSNGYSLKVDNTINANVGLRYNFDGILKGLSLRAMYAYDHYYSRSEIRNRAIDTFNAVKDVSDNLVLIPKEYEGGFDTFSESHGVYRVEYFEGAIEYQKRLKNHQLSGLILYNQRKKRIPGLEYNVPQSLQGFVGRATYNYSDRYFAEFNLGYNGSENFPENLRYGVFPAFSLGWAFTEEPFFPKNKILDWAKLRGSYGVVGNDNIGGDRFLYLPTTYAYGNESNKYTQTEYQFGTEGVDRESYQGAYENQIGNPYVTWEKAIKRNIGIDTRFFNSRLMLSADYFFENRNNILINRQTIPAIVGAVNLPAVNLGKVHNIGFELEAHWKDNIRDFLYGIDANFSFVQNKIIFQDEPSKAYEWMMSTGFSVGQLKGYRTDGLYNYIEEVGNRPYYTFYSNMVQRGDIKYIDIDGDGKIDQNDAVPIGYTQYPQVTFGCNFNVSWKNFDMSLLFQGATQTAIQQSTMTAWAFNLGANMTLSEHWNRWTEERFEAGEKITRPRLSSDGKNSPNSQTSDFWLEDASYVRLKNLELGYTIPKKLTSKLFIEDIRVYVNGNNLLTLTKLQNADPENPTKNVGAVYPQMKVFNIGANVKF